MRFGADWNRIWLSVFGWGPRRITLTSPIILHDIMSNGEHSFRKSSARKSSLTPDVVDTLKTYFASLAAKEEIVGDSLVQISREELDRRPWPCKQKGFERPPWQIQPGTKVYRSPVFEHIFGTIIGTSPVRNLKPGGVMAVHELLETLMHRNVLPFYMGGFIRDVLQGKPANDLDLSFACRDTNLHDIAQWAEGMGWKYSVKAKKQVSFEQAALGDAANNVEQESGLNYINFGDQDYDGWENGVEGKIFGNPGANGSFQPGWQTPDFTCNGLIYDPHLHLLIDPTGFGVDDALQMKLRIPANMAGEWKNEQWLRYPKPFGQAARWFKFRAREYGIADMQQLEWLMAQLEAHCNEHDLHVAFGTELRKLLPEKEEQGEDCEGAEGKQEEETAVEEEAAAQQALQRFMQLVREDARTCGKDSAWLERHIEPWLASCIHAKKVCLEKWDCIRCTYKSNTETECEMCGDVQPSEAEREVARQQRVVEEQEARIRAQQENARQREQQWEQQERAERGRAGSEIAIEMQPLEVAGDFGYQALEDGDDGVGADSTGVKKTTCYFLRDGCELSLVNGPDDPTPFGGEPLEPLRGPKLLSVDEVVTREQSSGALSDEHAVSAQTYIKFRGTGIVRSIHLGQMYEIRADQRDNTHFKWACTRDLQTGVLVSEDFSVITDSEQSKLICTDASSAVYAERLRRSKPLANLRGKMLSFSQRFCWLCNPPIVSVTYADGVQTVLRGPANGGWAEVWGPTHTMGDVKRAFEQQRKLQPGQTEYDFGGDGKEEVPDRQLLFHHMVPGSEVGFRKLTCLTLAAPEPCTITVRKMDGEEQRFEMNSNNTVADVKLAYEGRMGGPSRWAQVYCTENEEEPTPDEHKLRDCAEHTFVLFISEGGDAEERQARTEAEEWIKAQSQTDDALALMAEAAIDAFPLTCWEAIFYEGCVRFVRCCCGCSVVCGAVSAVGGTAVFLWLCITGALHGSVGGISGFGLVALVALVLGVQSMPSLCGLCSLGACSENTDAYNRPFPYRPFPWRHLLHTWLHSQSGQPESVNEGELQSIKAHRIIGEGKRRDDIEDSEVDSTTKINWIWFAILAAILTLIGWVSGVMLAAGARCVHSGGEELCGVGGYSGGVAMLVLGGLGPFFLAAAWVSVIRGPRHLYVSVFRSEFLGVELSAFDRIIVMIILLPLIVMIGAGSACVHSHGTHGVCGSAGEGGGVLMIVIGTIWLCTVLLAVRILKAPDTSLDVGVIAFVGVLLLGSTAMGCFIMVTAGSICIHSHGESELCGPGGEGGGTAMLVVGLLLLPVSSTLCAMICR
jgi:hypothetical protein